MRALLFMSLVVGCSAARVPASTVVETTSQETTLAREVLELVNAERSNVGVPALNWSAALADVAWLHSSDMVKRDFFSHVNPDGEDPFARLDRAGVGYRVAGENIAFGSTTAAEVVKQWMNSPPHRENILDTDYTELGVGVVHANAMWTQVFRAP